MPATNSTDELAAAQLAAWHTDEVRAAIAGSVLILDPAFTQIVRHGIGISTLFELGAWNVLQLSSDFVDCGRSTALEPIERPAHVVFFTATLLDPVDLFALVLQRAHCEGRASFFCLGYEPATAEAFPAALGRALGETALPAVVRVHRFGLPIALPAPCCFTLPGCRDIFPALLSADPGHAAKSAIADGLLHVLKVLQCTAPSVYTAGASSLAVADTLEPLASTLEGHRSACVLILDRVLELRSVLARGDSLRQSVHQLDSVLINRCGIPAHGATGSVGSHRQLDALNQLRRDVLIAADEASVVLELPAVGHGERSALGQLQAVLAAVKRADGGTQHLLHQNHVLLAMLVAALLSSPEADQEARVRAAQKLIQLELSQPSGADSREVHLVQLLQQVVDKSPERLPLEQILQLILLAYSTPADQDSLEPSAETEMSENETLLLQALASAQAVSCGKAATECEAEATDRLERCKRVLELQQIAARELELAADGAGLAAELLHRLVVARGQLPDCMKPDEPKARSRGMLGMLGLASEGLVADHDVLVCFVVGGASAAEVASVESMLDHIPARGKMPLVLLGSTSIVTPQFVTEQILNLTGEN